MIFDAEVFERARWPLMQKFLNEQDDLRFGKIDDLEQCGRRECLRFDGFEVSDAEQSVDCGKIVKDYIKKELKVELNDDDYYYIHRIELKKEKNGNKSTAPFVFVFVDINCSLCVCLCRYQLLPLCLFVQTSIGPFVFVCADINWPLCVCLCRYQLVPLCLFVQISIGPFVFVCADINCSLCVCLKSTGGLKYLNTMEEL